MNTERLLRVADLMDRVHAANLKFDISGWAGARTNYGDDGGEEEYESDLAATSEAFGTAACACGYAALDNSFRAEGFTLQATLYKNGDSRQIPDVGDLNSFNAMIKKYREGGKVGVIDFIPIYQGTIGIGAAAHFFGIPVAQAEFLFMPDDYENTPSAKDVADRIRDVIANGFEAAGFEEY